MGKIELMIEATVYVGESNSPECTGLPWHCKLHPWISCEVHAFLQSQQRQLAGQKKSNVGMMLVV